MFSSLNVRSRVDWGFDEVELLEAPLRDVQILHSRRHHLRRSFCGTQADVSFYGSGRFWDIFDVDLDT